MKSRELGVCIAELLCSCRVYIHSYYAVNSETGVWISHGQGTCLVFTPLTLCAFPLGGSCAHPQLPREFTVPSGCCFMSSLHLFLCHSSLSSGSFSSRPATVSLCCLSFLNLCCLGEVDQTWQLSLLPLCLVPSEGEHCYRMYLSG